MTRAKIVASAALAAAAVLAVIGWLRVGRGVGVPSYAAEARGHVPPMPVGMNLGSMTYMSQEFPFLDFIQQSQFWIVGPEGKFVPLDRAPAVVRLDAGGHPVRVPLNTHINVMIRVAGGHVMPTGTYDCRISPGWSVRPTRAATVAMQPGGFSMSFIPANVAWGIRLELTSTKPDADLTTLACRPRGAPKDAIFNPTFLHDLKPFGVLRFMDWMKTNNAPPFTWAERTTPASLTQASVKGVSVEDMVALVNTVGADPWFTQPLDADDSYYRNFATYVRDHLAPGRKAYVEVSNEVWNAGFLQARTAYEEGKRRYPDATSSDPNNFYYADRVRAVMGIWSEVFKGQEHRLVRVLSTKIGSVGKLTSSLTHADTAKFVDAVAVAPYFYPPPNQPTQDQGDPTDYVLAHGPEFVDHAIQSGLASKAVADKFGLPLITYEGGPAYVSVRPRLAAAFAAAEVDPRMYAVYSGFLTRWRDEVGGLYVAYDFVNHRFGHMLYIGQPLSEAPKMRALVDFVEHDKTGNRAIK